MGTRSLTRVFNRGIEILCIYRQMDGHISGMGADLAGIVEGGKFVNGISGEKEKIFNGMGCFAAQLVAGLKDGPGGIDIYPVGSNDVGEEFVYEFRGGLDDGHKPAPVTVKVTSYEEVLFDGPIEEYPAFVKAYDGNED